ncbi:hypothetical protein SK128_015211 [Halocaridina rubra]|uniref:Uncharacterized protein n=1 Tax=Halocaridina rubra TaxID=373956 RepID=A0AAN8ZZ22_HALRR
MLASVAWAPLLEMFGSLFQYFQTILSYLIPPVVALYIEGFFWKGANARAAFITLILGNVWGVALFIIVEVMGWLKLHFLHAAAILFILSLLLLAGVSLTNGKTCSEDQLKFTWSLSDFIEDTIALKELQPWKNYLLYCLLLIVLALVIVGCFW